MQCGDFSRPTTCRYVILFNLATIPSAYVFDEGSPWALATLASFSEHDASAPLLPLCDGLQGRGGITVSPRHLLCAGNACAYDPCPRTPYLFASLRFRVLESGGDDWFNWYTLTSSRGYTVPSGGPGPNSRSLYARGDLLGIGGRPGVRERKKFK